MNILSIDDDQDFSFSLEKRLSKSGHKVTTTSNVNDFLVHYYSFTPDVCLVDINLGNDGDGRQIIAELKSSHYHKTPVIALSRIDKQVEVNDIIELGADDFVSKPLDEYFLKKKIDALTMASEKNKLPMSLVPPNKSRCEIELDFMLYEVNDKELVISSPNDIVTGTELYIYCDYFKILGIDYSLKFKVSWSNKVHRDFVIGLQFNEGNRELLYKLKKHTILKNIQTNLKRIW